MIHHIISNFRFRPIHQLPESHKSKYLYAMPLTNRNQQDQLINYQNNNGSDNFLRYSIVNNMRYLLTNINNQVSTTRLIDHRIRRYWEHYNEDINIHLPYENYYADEVKYMNQEKFYEFQPTVWLNYNSTHCYKCMVFTRSTEGSFRLTISKWTPRKCQP